MDAIEEMSKLSGSVWSAVEWVCPGEVDLIIIIKVISIGLFAEVTLATVRQKHETVAKHGRTNVGPSECR